MHNARLLLGDDHALVLEGMRSVLCAKFDIIGAESDGRATVAAAERLRPDAVVLDIAMPILNGIEAGRQIKHHLPATKLVYASQASDPVFVRSAFGAGASAYVLKQSAVTDLLVAVEHALNGFYYLSPALRRGSSQDYFEPGKDPAASFGLDLTARQREVLQLVAEGKTNKEIAPILAISVKTVEFHKAGLMDHLGLRTTADLTRYAIEHGLLQSQPFALIARA